jgi:hypothetical protein
MYWLLGIYKMNVKLVLTAILMTIVGTHELSYSGEKQSIYIKPGHLKRLPTHVTRELERLNCLVPQGIGNHTNAIEGEYAVKGQKDWAVLCSVSGKAHIHISWGGSKKCSNIIAERSDADYLYKQSNSDWEYYRGIGKVGKKFIIRHYEAYGGPTPPPITHDAIDDRWLEKASVVYYCHQEKWVELTGAD